MSKNSVLCMTCWTVHHPMNACKLTEAYMASGTSDQEFKEMEIIRTAQSGNRRELALEILRLRKKLEKLLQM